MNAGIREQTIQRISRMHGERVSIEQRFAADLSFGSLDMVEMTIALEKEFDIHIPDEDVVELRTVGDAVRLVERLLLPSTPERAT